MSLTRITRSNYCRLLNVIHCSISVFSSRFSYHPQCYIFSQFIFYSPNNMFQLLIIYSTFLQSKTVQLNISLLNSTEYSGQINIILKSITSAYKTNVKHKIIFTHNYIQYFSYVASAKFRLQSNLPYWLQSCPKVRHALYRLNKDVDQRINKFLIFTSLQLKWQLKWYRSHRHCRVKTNRPVLTDYVIIMRIRVLDDASWTVEITMIQ